MRKVYDLSLPYFKQGDDLCGYKMHTENDADAFIAHAEMMESSAEILRKMASVAKENNLRIEDACTHCITVSCEEDVEMD